MWLYRLNRLLMARAVRGYWRMRAVGAVEAIPREGPVLLAANHASYLDPWLIGAIVPWCVRYLITREWYDRSRLANAIFRAFGTLPVEVGDPEATTAEVCRSLAEGSAVGIFPEGRISANGRLQRFRNGIGYMAARSGAPVIAMGIRGGFESLPKHRRVPRRTRVTIHVAGPVFFPGAPILGAAPKDDVRAFVERLFAEIARLTGQSRGDA